MTSAVDSNVVIALLSEDDSLNTEAEKALDRGLARGDLIICGPVYVEVSAFPGRLEGRVDDFLRRTGIDVDWDLEEKVWREAARASQAYAARRELPRKLPRRVAADFIIGAHALVRRYPLLTMDRRGFRTAFPNLQFAPESF